MGFIITLLILFFIFSLVTTYREKKEDEKIQITMTTTYSEPKHEDKEIDYSLFKHPEKKENQGIDYDRLSKIFNHSENKEKTAGIDYQRMSDIFNTTENKKDISGVDFKGLSTLHKNVDRQMQYSKYNNMSYYDFENKFYDRFYNMIEKWTYLCEDTKEYFEEHFNLNQRIKKIEKCISKFNEVKTNCFDYGRNGIKLYDEIIADDYKEIFEHWSKNDIIINTNGDNYEFEFTKINFCNYNFLSYLLNAYRTDTEKQKEHLKQEELFHKIYVYGGTEEYHDMLEYENELRLIRKEIMKILKKEDCILQSTLARMFDENKRNYVRKYVEELHQKGKISKVKNGSSYMLKYIQNQKQTDTIPNNQTKQNMHTNIKSWNQWDNLHNEPDQLKRQKSACETPCTPLMIDQEKRVGHFQGTSGSYITSLENCACVDFNRRKKPCKHMYRLAMELGLFAGDYKSKTYQIKSPKPKDGIAFEDAVKIIDAFTFDEKSFLRGILSEMKNIYHSEYAPISYIEKEKYKKLFDVGILEESKNTDLILDSLRRNELNERIIHVDSSIKFRKNMKREDLVAWIHENIPERIDEICSEHTTVTISYNFRKIKHKIYLYLGEEFSNSVNYTEDLVFDNAEQ